MIRFNSDSTFRKGQIMKKDTVLITGASSGMGREMARIVSKEAKKLILVGRNADRLGEIKKELESRD